jgi:hypothetical protein
VLAARALAYALVPGPTPLSLELQRSAGGPHVVLVAVCVLALALALAAAAVGLAYLAVRERLALTRGTVLEPPQLRPLRFAARYVLLFVATSAGFVLLESYLHWRAGLGWHGLHCLAGPVHRDAIPLLAGLSLVAVALAAAIGHLLAWARRTIASLLPCPRLRRPRQRRRPAFSPPEPARWWAAGALPARGPPGRISCFGAA